MNYLTHLRNFFLSALFLMHTPSIYSNGWLPDSLPISPTVPIAPADSVNLAYDPVHHITIATWVQASNSAPYYSVWNGTTWSDAAPIPPSASRTAYMNVTVAFDASLRENIAIWRDDRVPEEIVYNLFNGTTWTTAQSFATPTSVNNWPNIVYDAANGQAIALWPDIRQTPYYSTYNGTSWSTPAVISRTIVVTDLVNGAYDAGTGTVIAGMNDDSTVGLVTFSYNGTSWSGPTRVNNTFSSRDINMVYDPSIGQLVGVWSATTGGQPPFYSLYNGTSWSTEMTIPAGTSTGTGAEVKLTYSPDLMSVFAAWQDSNTSFPFYSIFNGTSWTAGAPIPSSTSVTSYDVNLAYDAAAFQVVAAWGETDLPFYQIYQITPAPMPPTGLVAHTVCNDFGTMSELIATLTWTLSPSTGVTAYQIYRNGVLVATVSGSTTTAILHNLARGTSTFSVVAINASGFASTAAIVTVKEPKCRGCS